MRVIIVEDEELAAERLAELIQAIDPAIEIVGMFDCIEETVEFLETRPALDLGFFDIQLADGLSFNVFEQTAVDFPVVFTTAFDQYALKAFEVNSIDYLLKPIEPKLLERAFNKFKNLKGQQNLAITPEILQKTLALMNKPKYKNRFLVKTGSHLNAFDTSDILYFWSADKMTWIRLKSGKKHVIDYTLEQIESLIDPDNFFRVNRKYFIQLKAIEKATVYSNSRLKLHLPNLKNGEDVIVSREKVQKFKLWFAG